MPYTGNRTLQQTFAPLREAAVRSPHFFFAPLRLCVRPQFPFFFAPFAP
jgi:hypothetical protein